MSSKGLIPLWIALCAPPGCGQAVDQRSAVVTIASALTESSEADMASEDGGDLDGTAAAPENAGDTSCIRNPPTLTVTPLAAGTVIAGTTAHYDVVIVNHDSADCPDTTYQASAVGSSSLERNIRIVTASSFAVASPGATITFGVDVTPATDADPGNHTIRFEVDAFVGAARTQFVVEQTIDIPDPERCFVSLRSELMITTTSVVDDPMRTFGNGAARGDAGACPEEDDRRLGVFSFGHLMRQIAPTEADAPGMVERLLSLWLTDQIVNGFRVPARPAMQDILAGWPRTGQGVLDLVRAPVQLEAIVNRVDLRDLSRHSAGEGRFVFAVQIPQEVRLPFMLILEYNLPARSEADVRDWANAWHALSRHRFGSEDYRAALEKITRRFTRRHAWPENVNGSALLRLRTNEDAVSRVRWELRQFELSPDTGFFQEAPLSDTPDSTLNHTQTFADFVNQNETALLESILGASTSIAPLEFEGAAFLGGAAFNDFTRGTSWTAPGINNASANFSASIHTCNGCHSPVETRTSFTQITPRLSGAEATLSPFLTGVSGVLGGRPRSLNDLARRKADLRGLVCPPESDAGPPDAGPGED
jgi:hypothetical protein